MRFSVSSLLFAAAVFIISCPSHATAANLLTDGEPANILGASKAHRWDRVPPRPARSLGVFARIRPQFWLRSSPPPPLPFPPPPPPPCSKDSYHDSTLATRWRPPLLTPPAPEPGRLHHNFAPAPKLRPVPPPPPTPADNNLPCIGAKPPPPPPY